ncbi:hypothetical protein NQ317_001335, partial [Molorchus minor]
AQVSIIKVNRSVYSPVFDLWGNPQHNGPTSRDKELSSRFKANPEESTLETREVDWWIAVSTAGNKHAVCGLASSGIDKIEKPKVVVSGREGTRRNVASASRATADRETYRETWRQWRRLMVKRLGTLIEIESRLNKIDSVLSEFDEYQRAIELSLLSDNEEKSLENHKSEKLECLSQRSNSQVSPSSSVGSVVALTSKPRLPPIPIPKFSGALENWLEFRDTFIQSMIHRNNSLGDVEKFHFLRSALEGNAKEVIQGLEFSAENYQSAWELLCERFNNPVSLVNNHLKAFFELQAMEKESAADLRRLLDSMVKHLRAIQNFGQSIETWDIIIKFVIRGKLDWKTRREWDEIKPRDKQPTLDEFKKFLVSRLALLQDVQNDKSDKTNSLKLKSHKSFVMTTLGCSYCKKDHFISDCEKFLKLNTHSKYVQAKKLKLCLNCLKKVKSAMPGHVLSVEQSITHCYIMKNSHQVVRERDSTEGVSTNEPSTSTGGSGEMSVVRTMFCGNGEVLLSTALVQVLDCTGQVFICRALLDNGSQSNLVTAKLCQRLQLGQQPVEISIIGVNQVVSEIKEKCLVKIRSLQTGYEDEVSCLVVPQISEAIPSHNADSGFSKKGQIDILLGADVFYEILCGEQIKLGKNLPGLQKTRLGWVVSGSVVSNRSPSVTRCNFSSNCDVQQQLEKFWAIEEPPSLECSWSEEDKQCERIFVQTTKRNAEGRFIVQIPLLDSPSKLGDSRTVALKRFLSLEKRLSRNPQLKERYIEFMEEYKSMGHMSLVPPSARDERVEYFLPHHGVLNENSLTTKLRVVFNGSFSTDTGVSINDLQYNGPTIQDDLMSILLRFREYNIVVCADISKMYRMKAKGHCKKIFWRSSPEEEIAEYTLNTVTYGTKSAPFLAIRCLNQLGVGNMESYPNAANVIIHDFYVDDMLSGATTAAEAVQLSKEVNSILKSGCFELRKWVSNDPQVLEQISSDCASSDRIVFGEKDKNKTLGVLWCFKLDVLMYRIDFSSKENKISKRSMLSDISRIFDPLGLLGPCVIIAKILLQKLWLQKIDWDEVLPANIHSQWFDLKKQFESLNHLKIPRHVLCCYPTEVEIHAFSDASMDSYGSCVYVRSVDVNGTIIVRLMCSKVKVAPLKVLTIPRLELCGALLMVASWFPFKRFSSLSRLKHTIGYCLRFIQNCRTPTNRMSGPLSAVELETSMKCLVKLSQAESFSKEILELQGNRQVQLKALQSLNTFLDAEGFLRVGGRLQLSDLDYAKKHPLLLSSKHHFTYLLFEEEHKRLLHAGPSRVSAIILGPDRLSRVAMIKIKNGEIKRSLSKLCPLPIEPDRQPRTCHDRWEREIDTIENIPVSIWLEFRAAWTSLNVSKTRRDRLIGLCPVSEANALYLSPDIKVSQYMIRMGERGREGIQWLQILLGISENMRDRLMKLGTVNEANELYLSPYIRVSSLSFVGARGYLVVTFTVI